jgi:hypothetical protein
MDLSPQTGEVDTLRIYGFSFDFPASHKLEFDPKFTREEGSLAIKSPSKRVVFVSWGELRKIITKLPTSTEHSKFSVERAARSVRGKLNLLEQRELKVSGHSAAYSRVQVEGTGGIMGTRKRTQEIESLHLHCDRTSRYFVIYASTEQGGLKEPERSDTLRIVANSFKCH